MHNKRSSAQSLNSAWQVLQVIFCVLLGHDGVRPGRHIPRVLSAERASELLSVRLMEMLAVRHLCTEISFEVEPYPSPEPRAGKVLGPSQWQGGIDCMLVAYWSSA